MLAFSILDGSGNQLVIDPALGTDRHIHMVHTHQVIYDGVGAGTIADSVKCDGLIFQRTDIPNNLNGL